MVADQNDVGSLDYVTSVLIGYATRGGTAHDIAQTIADELRPHGQVRVADLRTNPAVADADLVVLGSGIHTGAWYAEATAWIAEHQAELAATRVAIFNACLNAADSTKYDVALHYNDAVAKTVTPVLNQTFPGRYVPQRVSWWRRLFLRALQKPPQDHLDLNHVRSWAQQLNSLL